MSGKAFAAILFLRDSVREQSMNQTSVMTQPVDLRELAREWIAETITKHLAPELASGDRIKQVSAAFEEEARERRVKFRD